MPMNNGARPSLIYKVDAEAFTGGEPKARTSVESRKGEDLGWPPIHLEDARSGDEPLRDRGRSAHRTGQDGQDASSKRGAQQTAAREGLAHGYRVRFADELSVSHGPD